jgi:signal peptidase I
MSIDFETDAFDAQAEPGPAEALEPIAVVAWDAPPLVSSQPERDSMAWPPASWERASSVWRPDLWSDTALPQFPAPGLDPASGSALDVGPASTVRGGFTREVVETILLTLLIFFGIRLVVQNFKIEGMSMEPNLHDGQYLLVDKFSYLGSGEPQRGDVIVFESWSPDKDFIKRVIGLPGEHIQLRDDGIFINDVLLDEPYLDQASGGNDNLNLGPDEYYVMGDNRNNSSDSRNHGPMKGDQIIGKAWFTYWPRETIGWVDDGRHVFGAGSGS